MIPHWITLPLYSLIMFLISATVIFATESQNYECNTYLSEKGAKEPKECGNMTFETKSAERGSYVYTNCDNVMVRFSLRAENGTSTMHAMLLKLTPQEVKAAQEKRDIKEPKILSDLVVPEDQLPKNFALSHRDEQRSISTSCHKAQ